LRREAAQGEAATQRVTAVAAVGHHAVTSPALALEQKRIRAPRAVAAVDPVTADRIRATGADNVTAFVAAALCHGGMSPF
jgi:hypothetical protein